MISSGNTYISVSGDSESYGTDHPSEFVEFLQEKISGDFIWFRRDGKSYVIRDAATIKRAKDFFAAAQELDKKQEELGKQQEALGEKQEALGAEQEEVHVQIPDMTEDLHKLEAELKALGASGTQEDLGRHSGRDWRTTEQTGRSSIQWRARHKGSWARNRERWASSKASWEKCRAN